MLHLRWPEILFGIYMDLPKLRGQVGDVGRNKTAKLDAWAKNASISPFPHLRHSKTFFFSTSHSTFQPSICVVPVTVVMVTVVSVMLVSVTDCRHGAGASMMKRIPPRIFRLIFTGNPSFFWRFSETLNPENFAKIASWLGGMTRHPHQNVRQNSQSPRTVAVVLTTGTMQSSRPS